MLRTVKRCSAPRVDLIEPADYQVPVDEAHQFLTGKSRATSTSCRPRCRRCQRTWSSSTPPRRDRILSSIRWAGSIQDGGQGQRLALHSEGGRACVQVFFFAGQGQGNQPAPARRRVRRGPRHPRRLPGPDLRGPADPRLILLARAVPNAACWPGRSARRSGRRSSYQSPAPAKKAWSLPRPMAQA